MVGERGPHSENLVGCSFIIKAKCGGEKTTFLLSLEETSCLHPPHQAGGPCHSTAEESRRW